MNNEMNVQLQQNSMKKNEFEKNLYENTLQITIISSMETIENIFKRY